MQTLTQTTWEAQHIKPAADGLTIIGQLGQSLDGQIATATGHSKYINGQGGLAHLHALRAWADVVVVGVGTVVADNPKLTVRLTKGQDPDRVVIDPSARAPAQSVCLQDGPAASSVRRVILTAAHAQADSETMVGHWPKGVEQITLASSMDPCHGQRADDTMDQTTGKPSLNPSDIRAWLAQQGWQRVLLEGGAATLAGFLRSGCLDYLHLIVSPVLLGPGVAGVHANPVVHLAQVPRFQVKPFALGDDLLMECAFA